MVFVVILIIAVGFLVSIGIYIYIYLSALWDENFLSCCFLRFCDFVEWQLKALLFCRITLLFLDVVVVVVVVDKGCTKNINVNFNIHLVKAQHIRYITLKR